MEKGILQNQNLQNDTDFPLIMLQNVLVSLKTLAKKRVNELKSSYKGEEEFIAKILASEECIDVMSCWNQ